MNMCIQSARAGATAADGTRRSAGPSPWAVLAIILTAVFMQLLDTTITMVGVPSIQSSLHSSYSEIELVVAGYMLAFACVLVTGGSLGSTYGRKRMFLWGMAGFTVASAVCGAAPNALTLVIARVVQGMCSGLMFPQVLSIIQVVFRTNQRNKAIGLYGATVGLATILGPVTGGGLIDLNIAGWGWRSIFFVNVPIGLAALALGIAMIPESRSAASRRIDLKGAGLLGAGLFLLVLPLVIGQDEGWPAWSFACLAVSPFVLVAFALYERRRTRRDAGPLIDTTLFRQRPFSVGLIACLVFFTGIPSFFMILLLTLQAGLGYSPVKAGAVKAGASLLLRLSRVNLYVDYRPVLRKVDWQLRRGEHWAIHGANGAGKSSFLKLLYGDLSPALGGRIERTGFPAGTPIAEWKRQVGYVSPELQSDYAVNVNVSDLVISGRYASIGLVDEATARDRRVANYWLRFFGLLSVAKRRPRELSYGQLRRALIARAMAMDTARILLLDEPLTGLDPRQRAIMKRLMERLMKRLTLIIAVHHAEDLPRGMTRALRLHNRRAYEVDSHSAT